MPEQSRERSIAAEQGARTAQTRSARTAATPRPAAAPEASPPRGLSERAQRYLAAPGDGDARRLRTEIDRNPNIRLLRMIDPATPAFPALAVVEGTAHEVALLGERTGALLEPDLPLRYGAPAGYTVGDPTSLPVLSETAYETIAVEVRDEAGHPVTEAAVYVIDHDYPVRAVTGREGRAELRVPPQVCESATALIAQPARGHWSAQILRPALNPAAANSLTCHTLASADQSGTPRMAALWARHALGLDHQAGTQGHGAGARVALIDSGADLDHPDLADTDVTGYDLIERDEKSWRTDLLGCGTATASLLVGAGVSDQDGPGVTGVCREAELHALKVAPGGHTSDLIEALDYCIDHGIDVACVAAAAPGPSVLLAAKVQQARAAGVCVIAAAGDQPNAVAYPAALPGVLTVGALGRLGTFPSESHHASRLTEPGPDGFFLAGCTPHGATVDLYAPGVAVLSAAPGGGYVARDGTAPAAAHAAGIAALIAAHHPALRERAVRGTARADLLARLLLAAARPVQVGHGGGKTVLMPDGAQAVSGPSAPRGAVPSTTASPLGTEGGASPRMLTSTHL